MTTLPARLEFNQTELTAIDHEGKPWLSAADLAKALEYTDTRSVTKIYTRNQDEFSPDMVEVVKLTTSGEINGLQHKKARIFSPRGCYLIAMFAKTPRAKEFRKWVLDVLENVELPGPAIISAQQYGEIRQKVYLITNLFHYKGRAESAAYYRLRKDLGIKAAKQVPSEQFDAAMILLKHLYDETCKFHSMVGRLEQRFLKRTFRADKEVLKKISV